MRACPVSTPDGSSSAARDAVGDLLLPVGLRNRLGCESPAATGTEAASARTASSASMERGNYHGPGAAGRLDADFGRAPRVSDDSSGRGHSSQVVARRRLAPDHHLTKERPMSTPRNLLAVGLALVVASACAERRYDHCDGAGRIAGPAESPSQTGAAARATRPPVREGAAERLVPRLREGPARLVAVPGAQDPAADVSRGPRPAGAAGPGGAERHHRSRRAAGGRRGDPARGVSPRSGPTGGVERG